MTYKGLTMALKADDIKQALQKSFTLYQNSFSSFIPSPDQPEQLEETIALLFEIVKVMPLILQDRLSPHFKVSEQKASLGLSASSLGKRLYSLITSPYVGKINEYFPDEVVMKHPLIELFLSCLAQSELSDLALVHPILKVKRLKHFINAIHKEAKDQALAKKIKHRNDTVNKNYLALSYYIKRLLTRYPKVSLIQFELNYNPRINTLIPTYPIHFFQQVKQDREQFFKYLKSPYYCYFSRHLIGFAWKLKYTTFKGFYYELLLLYDIPEDHSIEQAIASLWTQTTGSYGGYQYKRIFYIRKKK